MESVITEETNIINQVEVDAISAITNRRSIRKYTTQSIDEKQVNTLLNAGFCAPSAMNKRPWHFIVVKEKTNLHQLCENSARGKMIADADCCIIVCGDKCVQGTNELLIEDCAAVTQNILIAAYSLGLGAVWCGVLFNSDWSKYMIDTFKLPEKVVPISVISLGYPDEVRTVENRFEQAKIHKETW